jgi:hypothetical protein
MATPPTQKATVLKVVLIGNSGCALLSSTNNWQNNWEVQVLISFHLLCRVGKTSLMQQVPSPLLSLSLFLSFPLFFLNRACVSVTVRQQVVLAPLQDHHRGRLPHEGPLRGGPGRPAPNLVRSHTHITLFDTTTRL